MTTEQRERPVNPFPGLRPFETEEYRLFFGREGQSDALIERLERSRFLAVVGTSGSGKSSLVRAGLLPGLRGGMMAGAGAGWRVAVLRPGHDPLGNLAHALAEEGVLAEAGAGLPAAEAEAVVEATLRRGSLGLVEAAAGARLGEREKLLVVVDQFEELFRFRAARAAAGSADDEAAAFVKLLLEAARQREVPVYVVLTMRSDFLGDCAQFQGLPEAINDGQYLIPRMTRDERRFAIVGPVRVARARMSEPLVNRLLNDVGDNPDQLPILQHALMRTWDYWSERRRDSEPVGLEHYEAVGTMADALSLHADEAWGELPDERSRRVAEILFKALTERGADNREIRRPTRLREVCEIAGATPEEVAAVVEVFRREGRSFLMPPAGTPLTPETVIDISHESLIRNWGRLKEWVVEESQSARTYRRLAEAAVLHREGVEALLQDPALQIALDWFEKSRPNAAWGRRYHPEFETAIAYLEESREARDARLAAERERERRELEQARAFAEQQARAARRLRAAMFGMAVLLLVALGTAASAMRARAEANDALVRAENLALNLHSSLRAESDAKQDAIRHQQDAETARKKAVEERIHADNEWKRAEAERKRADAEAKLAARHARDERRAKEGLRAALDKAEAIKAASQFFRHALTDMDRADSNEEQADAYNRVIESIEKFRRVGDYNGAASAYVTLGTSETRVPENLSRPERAEKYLPEAVKYYLMSGNPAEAGETLESMGDAYVAAAEGYDSSDAGDTEKFRRKAIRKYEEAYAQYDAATPKDWDGMASAMKKAASLYAVLGDKRKAVELFEKVVSMGWRHRPQNPDLVNDQTNLVWLYHDTEPPERADALIARLAAGARAAGDPSAEATLLGGIVRATGAVAPKFKYLERARELYRQTGQAAAEASLLERFARDISIEYQKTSEGRPVSDANTLKALEYYADALKYYEGQNADFAAQVRILRGIAELHEMAGRGREALAAYGRALSINNRYLTLRTDEELSLLASIVKLQPDAGLLRQARERVMKLLEHFKAMDAGKVPAAEKLLKEIDEKMGAQ